MIPAYPNITIHHAQTWSAHHFFHSFHQWRNIPCLQHEGCQDVSSVQHRVSRFFIRKSLHWREQPCHFKKSWYSPRVCPNLKLGIAYHFQVSKISYSKKLSDEFIPPCKSWLAVDKCRFRYRMMIAWGNDEYATNSSKTIHHRFTLSSMDIHPFCPFHHLSEILLYVNVIDDALFACHKCKRVWTVTHEISSHSTFYEVPTQWLKKLPKIHPCFGPAFSPASSCSWAFCRFLPALVRAWITFQGLAPLLKPPKKLLMWRFLGAIHLNGGQWHITVSWGVHHKKEGSILASSSLGLPSWTWICQQHTEKPWWLEEGLKR